MRAGDLETLSWTWTYSNQNTAHIYLINLVTDKRTGLRNNVVFKCDNDCEHAGQ